MRILIDALAAIGGITLALGGGVIGWCFLQSAADRREGRRVIAQAAQDDEAIAMTKAGDAAAMVKDWKPAPPARPVLRNIPVGDGAFHADGLDEAIKQIMKEGRP